MVAGVEGMLNPRGDNASYAVFVSGVFPAGRENASHFVLLFSKKCRHLNSLRQKGGNRNRENIREKIRP